MLKNIKILYNDILHSKIIPISRKSNDSLRITRDTEFSEFLFHLMEVIGHQNRTRG